MIPITVNGLTKETEMRRKEMRKGDGQGRKEGGREGKERRKG